jgi:hypothetical protein
VTLGVLHEGDIDAAVAVPMQVQGRLRPDAGQRRLLSRVRAIRAEVVERRLTGSVVADRRREVAVVAKARRVPDRSAITWQNVRTLVSRFRDCPDEGQ